MSPKPCDVCTAPLTNEDADWWCVCRSCGNLHFFCVTCVLLWGRQLSLDDRPSRNVWAEVVICPADAKATAELMGFDLKYFAQVQVNLKNRDQKFGMGLGDSYFESVWPPTMLGALR